MADWPPRIPFLDRQNTAPCLGGSKTAFRLEHSCLFAVARSHLLAFFPFRAPHIVNSTRVSRGTRSVSRGPREPLSCISYVTAVQIRRIEHRVGFYFHYYCWFCGPLYWS